MEFQHFYLLFAIEIEKWKKNYKLVDFVNEFTFDRDFLILFSLEKIDFIASRLNELIEIVVTFS